jgi:hypothetical protein
VARSCRRGAVVAAFLASGDRGLEEELGEEEGLGAMDTTTRAKIPSLHHQTEINWDNLDKTKLYVVGAGMFSGVTVALYPVSVIKTRMQVATGEAVRRNAAATFRNILKVDGVPGLYRGFGTVITGAIPARIIFLTALETTKAASLKLVEPFKLSEPVQAAFANGLGGLSASLCSQAVFVPIDVVCLLVSIFHDIIENCDIVANY